MTEIGEIEAIPQAEDAEQIEITDSISPESAPCSFPHVARSKVLAFWKPTFNNTNLATREFERRIHLSLLEVRENQYENILITREVFLHLKK